MDTQEHYRTLRVEPDASMAEIRQAYLAAARQAHPDLQDGSEAQRLMAEDRMRQVNAAWAVLGDVDRRSAYDRERLRDAAGMAGERGAAEPHFEPFDRGPDPEFDEGHDRPISDSRLPSWLSMIPVIGLGAGGGSIVLGGLLATGVLMAFGLVVLVVSALLMFVAAPLVTLGRAARGDRSP